MTAAATAASKATAAMTIDATAGPARRTAATPTPGGRRAASGPDRLTVVLFTMAAFLLVLALLAGQLHVASTAIPRPAIVMRKIYRTTVVETIAGGGGPSGTSVSQSVSSSGSTGSSYASPTTRTS